MPPPPSPACCAHDHDCEAADCGPAWSLHTKVYADRVRALNAAPPSHPAALLRAWSTRTALAAPPLLSDDDDPPELLLHIPFDGLVRITAIAVVGLGESGGGGGGQPPATSTPATLRAFVNRDGLGFEEAAGGEPAQEWELVPGVAGAAVEYPTRCVCVCMCEEWSGGREGLKTPKTSHSRPPAPPPHPLLFHVASPASPASTPWTSTSRARQPVLPLASTSSALKAPGSPPSGRRSSLCMRARPRRRTTRCENGMGWGEGEGWGTACACRRSTSTPARRAPPPPRKETAMPGAARRWGPCACLFSLPASPQP